MQRALKSISYLANLFFLMTFASCSSPYSNTVGFITTYFTEETNVYYYPYDTAITHSPNRHDESITSDGKPWSWSMNGTEAAVPDSRGLPEWIEFKWQELPPPTEEERAKEIDREKVAEQFRLAPIKTYRVYVRDKVPQDVINEILEAKRTREKSKLPSKMLQLYFTWIGDRILLGWGLLGRDANGSRIVLRKDGYFSPKFFDQSGS